MQEEWKDVIGYKGLYRVSNKGSIFSEYSKRIIKPYVSSDGYLRVNLCKNKQAKVTMLHRIVAEAFIPNPYNLPVVNHIDGNKKNPCVSNLEWVTFSQNSLHAYEKGLSRVSDKCRLIASKNAAINGAKSTSIKVLQISEQKQPMRTFNSIREAARETGVNRANIHRACKTGGEAGGYFWKTEE